MEPIRYKPGEAIRWIQTGAENIRKNAKTKGRNIMAPEEDAPPGHNFQRGLKNAAGAVVDIGKSAWADLLHQQASESEYVFQESHFDIVRAGSIKTIDYSRVKRITSKGDRINLILDRGSLTIRPYAYVVAGKLKVPIGWSRNGLEVPYELMIEELAARCGLVVEPE